ncbi:phosphate starvation-inducible protein [Escherichia coli]|uniref:Phosphate starvation-inducible protein n=1 Tax=Escherichia coli TaxID=562 RepID=A0A377AYG5_ECOLX|nr:phosphate starvation-inducible protein [Escherichia coli]
MTSCNQQATAQALKGMLVDYMSDCLKNRSLRLVKKV